MDSYVPAIYNILKGNLKTIDNKSASARLEGGA